MEIIIASLTLLLYCGFTVNKTPDPHYSGNLKSLLVWISLSDSLGKHYMEKIKLLF